ncbi:protein kinase domain-containing protein [Streptomyces sp. CA-294286]|uniref:serine/threonine-protein kinase n=1 Tax=Streptomyces sp. CA-294286 TaxID=3240070 RepID=UPI003D8F4DBE
MQPLEAGEPQNIGDYRLLGRLGSGGMGRVYLGRSAGGRTVAVKVVHPHFAMDEEFRARFRREVAAARKVGGTWTAPVLDADPDARVPWVATGYVAGPSLTQALAAHGPLPGRSVRVLGAGLAEALTAVHALGLVHRDVKPSNVLLTLDGPRLIDFGIARATDSTASLTSTGVSVGSPGYMAPEQILGKGVTPAADVFSLGAVLAYAATGTAPFPGDSAASLLYHVVHGEPELSGLESDLRELVAACLAKTADDRPAPAEVAARLAPQGAAAAVVAGWLPGALVTEAGRGAVRLLDLEAGAEPGAASGAAPGTGGGDAPSGPVPFTHGAVGYTHGATGGAAPVVPPRPASDPRTPPGFGPAPQPAGSTSGPAPDPGPAPHFGPAPHSGAAPHLGPAPHSGSAPGPPPPAPASEARKPGLSVSLATEAGAVTPDGTARRRSCTVVLAVAGVLAGVMLGGSVLLDMWPGQDGAGDGSKHSDSGAPPPAATATATAPGASAPARGPARVPASFVGTWSGTLTQGTTGAPHGTVTVSITGGGRGEDVLTTSYELAGFRCHGIGELRSATPDEIRVSDRPDPDRPSAPLVCSGETSDLVLTRNPDGTLRYRSPSAQQGKPHGTLTRR